eukprot:2247884-Pleurochrysis_carterae.AAC.3
MKREWPRDAEREMATVDGEVVEGRSDKGQGVSVCEKKPEGKGQPPGRLYNAHEAKIRQGWAGLATDMKMLAQK